MKQNNYISTQEGFIKDIRLHDDKRSKIVEYCFNLREAKLFSSKQAKHTLEILGGFGIFGFPYNPWKQEPIKDMYAVKLEHTFYKDKNGKTTEVICYKMSRAVMVHETDVNFLNKGTTVKSSLFTKEEAEVEVNKLNEELIAKLTHLASDPEASRAYYMFDAE